jgi:sigma-E factor negative regulatory protein RseA
MSEQQRQHVSALVDGEIDSALIHPTLAALETSGGLKAVWERYHLIGAAMRSEPVRKEYCTIAALVSERVAAEPVPLRTASTRRRKASRLGPFVSAALAAVVAFFAVFAVPQLFSPNSQSPDDQLAALSPPEQFLVSSPAHRWDVDEPALESKLDRFLVNHQEQSPASEMKGFLPYATVVGYEARR